MEKKHLPAVIVFLSCSLVGVQPNLGAISIPSNTSVGNWDDATRTYTLTQNLTEPIQIVSDGIILDGAGHTLISSWFPPCAGGGVSLYGRTGVTVKNLTIKKFGPGIYLCNSSNNNLADNKVSSCSVSGIYLFNCGSNNLSGNTVSNCGWGVFVDNHSNDNVLTNNATSDNWRGGIILSSFCNRNTLRNNIAANNLRSGITLWDDCNSNTITGNTVRSNRDHGIWLVRSHLNQVYNNNFINNTSQAVVSQDSSGSLFSLPAPHGGNYWDNWTSPDDNGGGFVGSPYVFPSGRDDLPWVVPTGWDILVAREKLQHLVGRVAALNLHGDIGSSLEVRIETALAAFDNVKDDNAVVIDSLQAFSNAVEALKCDKISQDDADALMTATQQIIDLLVTG
jgi:parallel beta-helix repeat protein